MGYELIKFVDGNFDMDVTVAPEEDTVWLTLDQMATLFDKDRSVIGKHVRNIFKEGELDEDTSGQILPQSTVSHRPAKVYNLDVIISVGYRVKSQRGISFRKWATNILKNYMIQGYAKNDKRLAVLSREIEVHKSLLSGIASMAGLEVCDILEVIESYEKALNLLDDYDHQRVNKPNGRNTIYYPTVEHCRGLIIKTKFAQKFELFGRERSDGMLKGILDQIKQHVFGQELYPSLEEKASNLLYMLVKDHIFFDGSKRIAAIVFLDFLNQNLALYDGEKTQVLSNDALVSVILMIAESRPEEKRYDY